MSTETVTVTTQTATESLQESAQTALARLIDMAVNGIEGTVDFAQAEIPAVIEQLLMWKLLESLIFMLMALGFFAGGAYLIATTPGTIRRVRKAREAGDEWTKMYPGSSNSSATYDMAVLGIHKLVPAAVLLFISSFPANLTWLYIWVAPKVYLLEYGASLVK